MARALLILAIAATLAGCGGPDRVNIALRKEIQELAAQVDQLQALLRARDAQILVLERSATTVPVLPKERLDALFTVHGLEISRLSHATDADPASPGDERLTIYVDPLDAAGDTLKAAGTFVIEAFDLNQPASPLVARCTYTPEQSKKAWVSVILKSFAFECKWDRPPTSDQVTVKVTFTDELTRRTFTAQKVIKVTPPPTTRPS